MSKRFQTTFIKVVEDDDVEFFQPLTPQQSSRRLMQLRPLHRSVTASRDLPTELPEREISKILENQQKNYKQLQAIIKRKGSKRIRGIELAKQLSSQGIGSASNKPSSPSKETDFGKVMEHEERELAQFSEALTIVMRKLRQKKQKALAEELAKALRIPETEEERKEREERETKIELQKEKDVVDLWNILLTHMRDKDPTLIDKIKFPDDVASKLTGNIQKKYKYLDNKGKETPEETEDFNYFEKFHPEKQRTFSESRVTYKDKDLPTLFDPEPEVDFYLEFDKANVDKIKSMCLRLRNLKGTKRPKDYYWLYIEATPLTSDGKKAGPTKYESFYTFEAKPELFERILESRKERNKVLLRQSQSGSVLPSASQSLTSGRKKKKTRGKGDGTVKRKHSKRR